jgi:hypothetical protein
VSRRNSAKKIKERKPETRKRIETMIKFRRQEEQSPSILFNAKEARDMVRSLEHRASPLKV